MAPHLLTPPALTVTGAAAPGRLGSAGSADPRTPRPRAPWPTFCSSPSRGRRELRKRKGLSVAAAAEVAEPGGPAGAMRLNEYMVAVDRPLGVRFALGVDGRVFVHSLRKGGNAEKSRIIMVGDTLKKAGADGEGLVTIKDLGDTETALRDKSGPCSLVLERPFAPFPIHQLHQNEDYHILFNRGRAAVASWNSAVWSTKMNESSTGDGKLGFAVFSPRLLSSQGWALLSNEKGGLNQSSTNLANRVSEIVGLYSDEDDDNAEWAHGSFPLEEYIKALDRAKGELYYNHSLGMQYSKITEQIFVGSCIQTEKDVKMLSETMGITAVLNFQSESERINWGINSEIINSSCRENNILMVNYPIREVDSLDLRKKLPFCVGLLLRLIRKNYRIYVTCTTGYDRSPACVISYLHWVQDTPLHIAHKFITGLHSCRPDRAAIVWATWDLIALVENGRHDGSPTHSVCFIWNSGREGEDVELVGDFTSNWKDKIRCSHKGGSRYEAEVRLRHGKYYYKFIVGGQWRHSTSLPTETDEHGNVNNVIRVGDIARIRPAPSQLHIKDPSVVKVIERALTEDERFLLAFAARRMAFAICPIRLSPKQ
ncbi:phosphoglucan phosphatase LSF1, chloroplastic [Zea mays]|uniref:Phosphoglucan phosphatase LSF1 chloroplastic n=5 Tax=Zea mays TaxID=4577 RepID=A0A1D6KQ33_MAIZE|nr:phosphoglucan phosphatase LSF1, chloroplastic [Zea mays]ONM04882.1 Phosphoglucan phosphatase LSF1 chloroplastic [Zea mays]|eukprot:XP_008664711.1 phosphoglucan phosphatase LSF1, chloroplastic [Zea mays]